MYGEVRRGRSWDERKRGIGGSDHVLGCRGCRSCLGVKFASGSWVAVM